MRDICAALHRHVCGSFTDRFFLPPSQPDVQPHKPSQAEGAEGPRRHDHGERSMLLYHTTVSFALRHLYVTTELNSFNAMT